MQTNTLTPPFLYQNRATIFLLLILYAEFVHVEDGLVLAVIRRCALSAQVGVGKEMY